MNPQRRTKRRRLVKKYPQDNEQAAAAAAAAEVLGQELGDHDQENEEPAAAAEVLAQELVDPDQENEQPAAPAAAQVTLNQELQQIVVITNYIQSEESVVVPVRKEFPQLPEPKDHESTEFSDIQKTSDEDDLNPIFPKSLDGNFLDEKEVENLDRAFPETFSVNKFIGVEPLNQDLDQADYSTRHN
ncbi:hypothetical protein ACH5RR_039742 [Cinchona calisaya]|uniref:Uncharacterized protein n=1 Tax=Cinchona calisaya TaxID=153742 RepID=A0ABD2Y2N2_9GENT